MRVLLVNPATDPEQFGRFAALLEPMPCAGLAYVATFIARAGHRVRVHDDFVEKRGQAGTLEVVREFRPDALGVSVLTPVCDQVLELFAAVRERWPGIRLFAGNIHADLFPELMLERCDAVVHGEGERASVELLDAWERGESGAGVPGVSVRRGDRIERGPVRPLAQDLDAFPFPDWSLLPYRSYTLLPLGTIARPIVAMVASRGCPHACEYCSLSAQGRQVRRRSVNNVVDEVEHNVTRFGVRQIGFMDPIFPLDDAHAVAFSREMIRRDLHRRVVWLSELRPDSVERSALVWMRRAGCRRLVLGIESGQDGLLEESGRRSRAERTRRMVRDCREVGITTVGLFMIGLPGETPDQTRATVDYACSLELDFAKFAITVPFPGSALYERLAATGILEGRPWDGYTTYHPDPSRIVVASRTQSPEQLLNALRRATARFYLRPGLGLRQLTKLRTLQPRQLIRGLWSVAPRIGR
jgi:anaerobic magnesium-protoporphyrin IX monomethyl ester cyclase